MSLFFYNIFLFLYRAGAVIASLFNRKARLWVQGRHGLLADIRQKMSGNTAPVIWMHCASLGEFEQGRPVLEKLKNEFPGHKIVLTFFSPSGYEIRKNYAGADHIFYLPMDGKINARAFIDAVKPSLVLWVKYEYWFHYLTALRKRNIPVLLISGIFRPSQPFFKWYGGMWSIIIRSFKHLFIQTSASRELLATIGITDQVTVSGDTRFDRVADIADNFSPLPEIISTFCGKNMVVVAGSTWEDDETEWIHYARLHPEIKFIIAPHEVDEENIKDVMKEFTGAVRYSHIVDGDTAFTETTHVLIIDNIGMLSKLYHYADITYIGGGFNDSGIHNVLEAAVYGKPVIFGPEYEKFAEAVGLVDAGAAFSIESAIELEAVMNDLLKDENKLKEAGKAARDFVYSHRGATKKIVEYIYEKRLLTN